jgi:hypothetical protein
MAQIAYSHLSTTATPLRVLGRYEACAPGRPAAGGSRDLLSVGGWGSGRGGAVPSAHDCPGRVRRVKAKPLRGRCASLDTSAHGLRDLAPVEATGGKQGTQTDRSARSAHSFAALGLALHWP